MEPTIQPDAGGQASAAQVYFLTLATPGRQPWLERPRTRDVFLSVLRSWHMGREGRVLAAIVMPDHAHVLLEPGRSTGPLQLVARWKSAMRFGAGYAETFDESPRGHKLYPGQEPEDYAFYMFLHPYRAGLIQPDETWPGWWLPEPALFRFPLQLGPDGTVPPEWLVLPRERFIGLDHGE